MQVTRILIHLNQNRTLKLNLGQWLRPWASWKFYEWDYILRLTIVVLDCDSLQNLPLVFCLTSSVWGVKDKSCHKLCPHLFQLQRLFLFPYQNIWTLSFQAFACSGEVQVFVRPHATSYHASHKHFIKVKKKKTTKNIIDHLEFCWSLFKFKASKGLSIPELWSFFSGFIGALRGIGTGLRSGIASRNNISITHTPHHGSFLLN